MQKLERGKDRFQLSEYELLTASLREQLISLNEENSSQQKKIKQSVVEITLQRQEINHFLEVIQNLEADMMSDEQPNLLGSIKTIHESERYVDMRA